MKTFVLAAFAAMSLGMGVAVAQPANFHNTNFLTDLAHPQLPSPAYSYAPANG